MSENRNVTVPVGISDAFLFVPLPVVLSVMPMLAFCSEDLGRAAPAPPDPYNPTMDPAQHPATPSLVAQENISLLLLV